MDLQSSYKQLQQHHYCCEQQPPFSLSPRFSPCVHDFWEAHLRHCASAATQDWCSVSSHTNWLFVIPRGMMGCRLLLTYSATFYVQQNTSAVLPARMFSLSTSPSSFLSPSPAHDKLNLPLPEFPPMSPPPVYSICHLQPVTAVICT